MKIVKVGGSVLYERHQEVARALAKETDKLLIVVGYGPRLRSVMSMHGLVDRRLQTMHGRSVRVTDDRLSAAAYFASSIEMNNLMEALQSYQVRCRCLYGSNGVLRGSRYARPRYWDQGELKVLDDDFSGRITRVDSASIKEELSTTRCLILAPLIEDTATRRLLVCDADTAAIEIAAALSVDTLVFVTDVAGFYVDGAIVPRIAASELDGYMRSAASGMKRKLRAVKGGFAQGLRRAVVGDLGVLRCRDSLHNGTVIE